MARTALKLFLTAGAVIGCPQHRTSTDQPHRHNQQLQAATTAFVAPTPIPADSIPFARPFVPRFATWDDASSTRHCRTDNSGSAILDWATGELIAGKNENKILHPASLVKIMTLYIVGEEIEAGRLSLDDKLTIRHKETKGDFDLVCIGLEPKYKNFRVRDAIGAAGIVSDAGATNILAYNISGTVDKFVDRMNQTADRLGLHDTHFVNPHGGPVKDHQLRTLPNALDNYSTPSDMAVLAFKFGKRFENIVTLLKHTSYNSMTRKGKPYKNWAIAAGAEWGKTGVTDAAGNCIAAYNNGMMAVTMGTKSSQDRKQHLKNMFAFANKAVYQQKLRIERQLQLQQQTDSLALSTPAPVAVIRPVERKGWLYEPAKNF